MSESFTPEQEARVREIAGEEKRLLLCGVDAVSFVDLQRAGAYGPAVRRLPKNPGAADGGAP